MNDTSFITGYSAAAKSLQFRRFDEDKLMNENMTELKHRWLNNFHLL